MRTPIYLDYSATAPVDPRVAQRMSECLLTEGKFGNPASHSHVFGWEAEEAVEDARRHVADLIGADPREIVWTSGATESDNLAIKGVAEFHQRRGRHIVASEIEHKAVLDTCKYLATKGFEITLLAPEPNGQIDPAKVAAAIREDTILVSIMHANNEIGVLNDIAAIGAITRGREVFFHVDAAQSAGKIPIDVNAMQVDLMSISGHKMYGPKGVGVLYVRRNPPVRITAQIHGGGHERGMRSGTLPTHQVVGMGEACRICGEEMADELARVRRLREELCRGLSQLPSVQVNGDLEQRLPGNLNMSFGGVDSEALMMALNDIAVSSGSACTSATIEPS
ncbi:MAG: IscS subfamily cysteine desulfurase, partial [Gammaproteobacteria bacterium]|nr:IscS subfamily cysteine desulfurase [Gammaproteobacteria bacterium]